VRVRVLIAALLGCCACAVTARPAELVTLPPAPPPGPWQVMRSTLDGCAQSYGLAGDLRVRIDLDHFGKVVAVDPAYGDAFASCVGNALLRTRYHSYADRALMIAFRPAG
jgi:hypothetical protein